MLNARLEESSHEISVEDATRRLAVLQAANRIAHLLGKANLLEQALEPLIAEFIELVQADCGSIQLLRPGSERTHRTLIRKSKSQENGCDPHLENLLTGWILKHHTLLLTDDLAAQIKLGVAAKRYENISSVLAVPITQQENVIGVVNLIRLQPSSPFAESHAQMALALAQETVEFIEQAHVREQLFSNYQKLRQEVADRYSLNGILGRSPAMNEVFSVLDRVIPTEGRVLLQGESGTGKELIAKIIHHEGPRKNHPFVAVDCGALPPTLLESELFGHVRGSFTGADRDRRGLFEEAGGGTLFLDEIANTTLETQSKLLRVLQEGEIRPIGANQTRKVDVRIITAASIDLNQRIAKGEFRSDLFFRLNVVSIRLPALRERVEDIPTLAASFLKRFAEKHGKQLRHLAPDAIKILERYSWPGNVRELENVIERAVILAKPNEPTLKPEYIPFELSHGEILPQSHDLILTGNLDSLLANYEREILRHVLNKHDWNQTTAAKELKISERVMRYKIKRLSLPSPKK